ncbi:MAG: hypothetical protein ACOYXC_16395 [Candidatus Rifleibacteriota bacterium]
MNEQNKNESTPIKSESPTTVIFNIVVTTAISLIAGVLLMYFGLI